MTLVYGNNLGNHTDPNTLGASLQTKQLQRDPASVYSQEDSQDGSPCQAFLSGQKAGRESCEDPICLSHALSEGVPVRSIATGGKAQASRTQSWLTRAREAAHSGGKGPCAFTSATRAWAEPTETEALGAGPNGPKLS